MAASLCSMNNHKTSPKKKTKKQQKRKKEEVVEGRGWRVIGLFGRKIMERGTTLPVTPSVRPSSRTEEVGKRPKKKRKGGQRAGHHGFFMTTLTPLPHSGEVYCLIRADISLSER